MNKKAKAFFTSVPFISFMVIGMPLGISIFNYVVDPNNTINNNGVFEGYNMPKQEDKFVLQGIQRLFRIANYSSQNNYQGGAFYKHYYAIAANDLENIVIYDMNDYAVDIVINDTDENTLHHCNNISFGNTFYSPKDKYPLLYISMENAKIHATHVYRIHRSGNKLLTSKVQEIVFPSSDECGVYFPNSYVDQKENKLYYAGYTTNSYKKSVDNKLQFFRFALPNPPSSEGDLGYNTIKLDISKAEDTFQMESETAAQGGFIANNHLYQTYGFKEQPIFRITDLESHLITYEIELGPLGYYDEFENVAVYKERLFAFGIKSLSMFELNYTYKS